LFNFFNGNSDKAAHQAAQQNPGIPVIATLCRYKHEHIGFEPNTEELVTAFVHMASDRFKNTLAYPNNAFALSEVFDTLMSRKEVHLLPAKSVGAVLQKLPTFLPRKDSNEVMKAVDLQLVNYCLEWLLDPSKNSEAIHQAELDAFIRVLCNYGEVVEARKACVSLNQKFGSESIDARSWTHIMNWYVRQKDEQNLLETWDEIEELGLKRDESNYLAVFEYYLEVGKHDAVRKWYDKMISEDIVVYSIYRLIFFYYSRPGISPEAYAWSNDIFTSFLSILKDSQNPAYKFPGYQRSGVWILVFQWCLAQGKGVDDIDKLMYSATTTDGINFRPDIQFLNGLIKYAVRTKKMPILPSDSSI